MDVDIGFETVDALLGHAAKLSYELDDQSLGHGLIDLARTARKEIESIGLKDGTRKIPQNSYEGMLLYAVLPELARRLMLPSGIDLLKLPEEDFDKTIRALPDAKIRYMAAVCFEHATFDIIAEKVRDKYDPEYHRRGSFFATEAIARNPLFGSIVEVAASRVSKPVSPDSDFFARLFHQAIPGSEVMSWDPDLVMEENDDEMDMDVIS
jgi:hypothetical protein